MVDEPELDELESEEPELVDESDELDDESPLDDESLDDVVDEDPLDDSVELELDRASLR